MGYLDADKFLKISKEDRKHKLRINKTCFNTAKRENGEIALRISIQEDSIKSAVDVMQRLYDDVFCDNQSICDENNRYLYVEAYDAEQNKGVCSVMMHFNAAEGVIGYLAKMLSTCIEVKYDNQKNRKTVMDIHKQLDISGLEQKYDYAFRRFDTVNDLVNFLNKNEIKKDNIISIMRQSGGLSGKYLLIYTK